MVEWRFHTPGWVDQDDLPREVHEAWHKFHAELAQEFIGGLASQLPSGTSPSVIPYVDPTTRGQVPDQRTTKPVPWDGFPESVTLADRGEAAYESVEHVGFEDFFGRGRDAGVTVVDVSAQARLDGDWRVRDRQDEYLEWHAFRGADGVLEAVTFVCEGYDYFDFLFSHPLGRPRVVELYQEWTDNPALRDADLEAPGDLAVVRPDGTGALFAQKGGLNPRNIHNRENGIVHLSHKANSLVAEVRLAVTSALPRRDGTGRRVDGSDPKRLMCCTHGGEPSRSSDPRIAAGAYAQVTDDEPKRFTLTDPIGLYIRDYQHRALQDPDKEHLTADSRDAFWDPRRGRRPKDPSRPVDSRILRLHVEVPEGEGYRLGDMFIDNKPLRHPGQLAQLITMHLLVDVWKAPAGVELPDLDCKGGCCKDEQGVLDLSSGRPGTCPEGHVDPYPGLVMPIATPAAGAPLAAPEPVPLKLTRRRL